MVISVGIHQNGKIIVYIYTNLDLWFIFPIHRLAYRQVSLLASHMCKNKNGEPEFFILKHNVLIMVLGKLLICPMAVSNTI